MSPIGQRSAWRSVCAGVLAVQLVMAGAAAAADRPESFYPAHVYTETRTELVWDGKPVVVEGTVHCQRPFGITPGGGILFPLADSSARRPQCTPEWLATRLDDGSALLVGAYAGSVSWRRDGADEPVNLDAMREHLARVPRAVIWLDDPVNPTRGEYYFSSIALEDPRSRLTAISTELVSVSRHGMALGALFGKRASDPAKVVPWLPTSELVRKRLIAVYMIAVPPSLWTRAKGLEEVFQRYKEPTLIRHWDDLSDEQHHALYSATKSSGPELIHTMMWVPEDVASFSWAGRWSATYYQRSLLMRPMAANHKGVFHNPEYFIRGVLVFTSELPESPNQTISVNMKAPVSLKADYTIPNFVSVYDPVSKMLWELEETFF